MLPVILAAAAMTFAACGIVAPEPPACRPGVPAQSKLLREPAFKSLTHHKRVGWDVRRGFGYDLWGDSNFEYGAGLEFSLVHADNARNDEDLCAQAVSLKLGVPMEAAKHEMLRAFVRAMELRTADSQRLANQLEELLARREKYRTVMSDASMRIEAGIVSHVVRGEFFVVTFSWPRNG